MTDSSSEDEDKRIHEMVKKMHEDSAEETETDGFDRCAAGHFQDDSDLEQALYNSVPTPGAAFFMRGIQAFLKNEGGTRQLQEVDSPVHHDRPTTRLRMFLCCILFELWRKSWTMQKMKVLSECTSTQSLTHTSLILWSIVRSPRIFESLFTLRCTRYRKFRKFCSNFSRGPDGTNPKHIIARSMEFRALQLDGTYCNEDTAMHEKKVITTKLTLVGSYNLTYQARIFNQESMYCISTTDQDIQVFDEQWNSLSTRVCDVFNPDPRLFAKIPPKKRKAPGSTAA